MTPARDRLARILMILLGLSAVGAFVGAAVTIGDFAPDRVGVEIWRMLGYLVFAGLFVLLGIFPRRLPGLWELVFFHKAGKVVLLVFVFEAADPEPTIFVDSTLSVVTLFCYLLTQGWRAWLPAR
ncbi:MAG: hypothetical protein Q7V31_11705 [Parvibaculum sp.]|uniref:hypothetical protein n=1 Tax=Parvibaculum sp. TaxID=2024848 RepID=UPI00271D2477|nr:hypothetical protein [Parvibaculum sp.]MDO8839583.1 hypothetical protein [Parvibaculum sp.]